MKIAILGVGTELTTGQILNRNGQWLSQRLYQMGIETNVHMVVPDDRKLIREALDFLQAEADIVLVTGGLGPTSDDFTRDLISDWSGKKLEFHSPSWEHLQKQLGVRGLIATDIHRQECYFPSGAQVFQNNVGTANAFFVQKSKTQLFALPGPPKEIEGLWKDGLQKKLQDLCQNVDPKRTWSWDCIGLAEAELASKVEAVLLHCPLEKAYRVHLPYVEFKLSYTQSQEKEMQVWQNAVEQCLKTWIVARNGEDLAQTLCEKLYASKKTFWICDELTGNTLISRLLPYLKTSLNEKQFSYLPSSLHLSSQQKEQSGLLITKGSKPNSAKILLYNSNATQEKICDAPERYAQWPDRQAQYFAEMAILEWLKRSP